MNILYIIGNGLDISHHMKTSYQDFFKDYLAISTGDPDIKAMKEDINSHRYETWADLEIGMGAYAYRCQNKDVFLKCLADIKSNLNLYLQKESEKIGLYKLSSHSGFVNPGLFLDPEPKNRFEVFRRRNKGQEVYINVMTFNYTSTLETLLAFKGETIKLANFTFLNSILHVHGLLNNMMVMGVNDSTQIPFASFSEDLDVVEEFIKPEFNDACMNNKNGICEALIKNANVIVLYGTSLGKSDVKWWRLIGQRMETEDYPLIIYLPYDETKAELARPNYLRRWTMGYVNEIRDKFDIQIDEKVLASRMCIAINRRLFQITKDTQQSSRTR